MSSIYCACGHKAEYSAVKPKFCASCGNPFDAAFKRAPIPPTAANAGSASVPQAPVYQSQPYRVPYDPYASSSGDIVQQAAAKLTAASIEVVGESGGQNGERFKLTEDTLRNAVTPERPTRRAAPTFDGGDAKSDSAAVREKFLADIRAQADAAHVATRKRQFPRPSRSKRSQN